MLPGNEAEEIPLDFHRILVSAQPQPPGDPADVDVDGDPFVFMKGVAQDDVGRFPGDAGKRQELVHGRRDLAPEVVEYFIFFKQKTAYEILA